MKILSKNLKKQEVTIKIESPEDIWVLSQVIETGDFVKGKTERKIKIGDENDRNAKVIRKPVFLSIHVEKVEFQEDNLKVLGTITECPEDISKGEHHSFRLEQESIITIIKEKWLKYQFERIEDATKGQTQKILMVVFDREEAYLAKLKGQGYEILTKITGDVQKKDEKHVSKDDFYKEIIKKLTDYQKDVEHIILASPGFWKDTLQKEMPEELKKKIVTSTVSQATERGISEVMKRPELHKILENNRATKEMKQIDILLENISKDKACYGMKECKQKVHEGAVSDLIVSHRFLQESREKNFYEEVEGILFTCEQTNGKVHIITSDEAGKTLNSLSGIAGILRWKS